MNLWASIKNDVDEFLYYLESFCKIFAEQTIEERKLTYYKQREEFNSLDKYIGNLTYASALFLFLNKTGFNGLCRYNSKGKINTACGKMDNVEIYNKYNIVKISELLKKVQIVYGDYSLCKNFIDKDTFVYFDPPYRPITKSCDKFYTSSFGDREQIKLSSFVKECSNKDAYFLLSNSDPHNVDINDNFFDDLYRDFVIERVLTQRTIQSGCRQNIYEILVHN